MVVYNQGLGEEVHTINSDIAVDDIGYFVLPLANNQTLNVNPAGPARFIYSGTQHLDEGPGLSGLFGFAGKPGHI